MIVKELVFYFFSAVALLSAVMVITSRNTVHGVLFLVLTFFCSAALWMLLQAEFLALVLIFVYIGAVMTLFLFVVMMLNIELTRKREGFVRYLPFGVIIVALLVGMMMMVIGPEYFGQGQFAQLAPVGKDFSDVEAIGAVLYTDYLYAFEIAAVLLLVAIISAISLAFRGPQQRKTQVFKDQIAVRKEDRLKLIDMKSEKP